MRTEVEQIAVNGGADAKTPFAESHGSRLYRTIVADPPWDVKAGPGWNPDGKTRPLEYPTMTTAQIAALPVRDLCEPTGGHLYLWTINKYIQETYDIARAWGYEPSTLLTWCKRPMKWGLGGTYALTTEHCLFARRGSCRAARREPTTWWEWPRRRHSEKPDAFMDMVEQVSPPTYLELFARRQRLGWHSWGNECLNHIELNGANIGIYQRDDTSQT